MAETYDTLRSLERADDLAPQDSPAEDASVGPCLDVDTALAFAEGRLDANQIEALHAHVDGCEGCQLLVAEAAHALQTPSSDDEDGRDGYGSMFRVGALVGNRYVIRRFVARGGMGEVYEAFDRDLLKRVALKTVASTASDSTRAVRRLKAEVQLAHRVSHPNVCRIYDIGAHDLEPGSASVDFLTMEYVEGQNLGERLQQHGALTLSEALSVARQLLLGLAAAHDAGILHRDFKSHNVMLRIDHQGELVPVILDFGLARALRSDAAQHTSGRNQGLVGTLKYMAPEQIEGKPLGAASDIYAFGVVWFEMLTGRLPFIADSAAATALERLRSKPPAPSSINPSVPAALDRIVLRCLSRDPAARFESADRVLQALDTVNLQAPSRSRPRYGLYAVGTAAVLAVISAAAVALDVGREEAPRPAAADRSSAPPGTAPAQRSHVSSAAPEISSDLATVPSAGVLPAPSGPSPTPVRRILRSEKRATQVRSSSGAPPLRSAEPVSDATAIEKSEELGRDAGRAVTKQSVAKSPLLPSKEPDWVNPFAAKAEAGASAQKRMLDADAAPVQKRIE